MTREEIRERSELAGAVTYRMVTAALWAVVRVAAIVVGALLVLIDIMLG